MGLAVYNSINLDIRLPLCCYKKLLSPAVVPFQHPNAPVGMAQLGLNDLSDVNPVRIQRKPVRHFNNILVDLILPINNTILPVLISKGGSGGRSPPC